MKASPPSAFRGSRWFKCLMWGLALYVIYILLGFFALPPLIKWQMLKNLPITTKHQAAIREVKVNPLTLSLSIRGLQLTEPDGRPFLSWDDLYINFQASSLFRWAWTFKEIRLVRPFGQIIKLPDGHFNFADMFNSTPKSAPAQARQQSVPRINIFDLQVLEGFLAVRDETRHPPFRSENQPINLVLHDFTTRPGIDTPYSFEAHSDTGRRLAWAGNFMVQPLRSLGHLELDGIRLSRWQTYLNDFTLAQVTNTIAAIAIDYYFAADTNSTDLIVTNGIFHFGDVQLRDPETGETVAGLEDFVARRAELNLRQRTARLGSVKISGASVLIRRKPNGHFNLLDLLTVSPPATNSPATNSTSTPSAPTQPWLANVDDLALDKSSITFEDLTLRTPFKTRFDPIEISLKDFTTGTNSNGRYSFHMVSESAEVGEGSGSLSLDPPSSSGEVKWTTIDLKKYLPYAEPFFQGKLTGQFSGQMPYAFSLTPAGLELGASNVSVAITGLEVKAPGSDENVASINRLALEGAEASLAEQRARVASIKFEQGSLLCRRQKDGSINLLQLLAPAATNPPPANANPGPSNPPGSLTNESAGWTAIVDDISLNDYTIKIEDLRPPKPATFLLDQLALDVKGASTVSNAPVSASLDLRFNETGSVAVRAKATLEPRAAEVQIGLTNIELRAVQPYLEDYVSLGIVSGALGGALDARYQTADSAAAQVKVTGQMNITNFACTDEVAFKEFMRWEDFAVSGIDAELEPTRLKVAEVKWVGPQTSVLIGPDHRPNVTSIMKKSAADSTNAVAQPSQSVPTQASSQTNAGAMPIQVDVFRLEKAALLVTDESIEPKAKIGIQELSGSIKGLSSAVDSTADVDLSGKIDEHSPFAIMGRINPLSTRLFADLTISNADTQLTPLSTYMAKYAGHPLNRGRLSTDLRYHLEGKEINAQNRIYIDQLTLGPRNHSPDATTLPVKLGIALLKDSNGRIALDVPVQGSFDDPKFRIAPIVFKVIMNMITKAVASPFKLLGSLVGGGGEEMSYVKFYPGGTNVVEGELDKLGKLSKALAQRPALSLDIEGAIDPVADRQALARQKLREQLKAKELQQLDSKDKAAQSVDTLQLSEDDYNRLLREAFAEKFGTNIAAILQTNLMALAAATNEPAGGADGESGPHSKESLSKRMLGWVGLGSHSHQSKAEKHLPKADRLALRQLPPGQMERMLAEGIDVSADDYRDLMNARARLVQTWLVENARVPNERLLLSDPQPVNADYKGESEVQLSLE